MVAVNPFHPTFGSSPRVLVGRELELNDFIDTFEFPDPGHPGLTTLITGARGTGKTVMLGEYAEVARRQGWIAIEDSGAPGLMERLGGTALPKVLAEVDPAGRDKLRSIGFSFAGAGVNAAWESRYPVQNTVREQVETLCDLLAKRETGLMITVDEVTGATTEDLQALSPIAQFMRRSDRLFALGVSGLKSEMDDFLQRPGTTFLRRAERVELRGIPNVDAIKDAYRFTVNEAGRSITDEACDLGAHESMGYPYLIQRIGFDAWRQARDEDTITVQHVARGVEVAKRTMGKNVHEPALKSLSGMDRAYLLAMSLDGDKPSHTGDVAQRLGVDPRYASTYRSRLIDADMIEPVGHGAVRYTIPYLGDYLRGQSERMDLATLPARYAALYRWQEASEKGGNRSRGAESGLDSGVLS